MTILSFLKKFGVFTLLIAGVIAYLHNNIPGLVVKEVWWFYLFFFIITLFGYLIADYGIKKGGEYSIYAVLVTIVLRMLLCMVVALVYIQLKMVVNQLIFVGNFFVLYFLFTSFEIYCLIANLRAQKKR